MLRAIKDFLEEQLTGVERGEEPDPEHVLHLATTALLIEISRSDAEVTGDEERAIARVVQQAFGLEAEETRRIMEQADGRADEAVSLHEFTRVLNEHLTRERRAHMVELLWRVAFADGRLDKYEDYYVRKIADLLHVSHKDFIRTKHLVMGEG